MKLLKQPTAWTCLPTAVAMVLDISVEDIFKTVGHDGSAIVWPELGEPGQRRSFHLQEMMPVIINQGNYPVIFEMQPLLLVHPDEPLQLIDNCISKGMADKGIDIAGTQQLRYEFDKLMARIYPLKNQWELITKYMQDFDGVLVGRSITGSPHAVAWSHVEQMIYNPNGMIHSINSFHTESFLVCF